MTDVARRTNTSLIDEPTSELDYVSKSLRQISQQADEVVRQMDSKIDRLNMANERLLAELEASYAKDETNAFDNHPSQDELAEMAPVARAIGIATQRRDAARDEVERLNNEGRMAKSERKVLRAQVKRHTDFQKRLKKELAKRERISTALNRRIAAKEEEILQHDPAHRQLFQDLLFARNWLKKMQVAEERLRAVNLALDNHTDDIVATLEAAQGRLGRLAADSIDLKLVYNSEVETFNTLARALGEIPSTAVIDAAAEQEERMYAIRVGAAEDVLQSVAMTTEAALKKRPTDLVLEAIGPQPPTPPLMGEGVGDASVAYSLEDVSREEVEYEYVEVEEEVEEAEPPPGMRMGPDGRYVLFYPATETITEEEFRARYGHFIRVEAEELLNNPA